MKVGYTDITVVVDRSGSMSSILEPMIAGFNEFVAEQRKQPGEATLTLVEFDYADAPATPRSYGSPRRGTPHIDTLYASLPLAEVPPFSLTPRGWTNLHDAVAKTIIDVGARYAAMPESERPEKVVFVVVTDGYDNRSFEYSRDTLRTLVEHQQSVYSWQFVFLGANMNAVEVASNYGIPVAGAATYGANTVGVRNAFASVSRGLNDYRGGQSQNVAFTESERTGMASD